MFPGWRVAQPARSSTTRALEGTERYVKVSAFEVPDCVVIVTPTVADEVGSAGTTRVQECCPGHVVGAGAPAKCARISPSALKRFVPVTTTSSPGTPDMGDIPVSCGRLTALPEEGGALASADPGATCPPGAAPELVALPALDEEPWELPVLPADPLPLGAVGAAVRSCRCARSPNAWLAAREAARRVATVLLDAVAMRLGLEVSATSSAITAITSAHMAAPMARARHRRRRPRPRALGARGALSERSSGSLASDSAPRFGNSVASGAGDGLGVLARGGRDAAGPRSCPTRARGSGCSRGGIAAGVLARAGRDAAAYEEPGGRGVGGSTRTSVGAGRSPVTARARLTASAMASSARGPGPSVVGSSSSSVVSRRLRARSLLPLWWLHMASPWLVVTSSMRTRDPPSHARCEPGGAERTGVTTAPTAGGANPLHSRYELATRDACATEAHGSPRPKHQLDTSPWRRLLHGLLDESAEPVADRQVLHAGDEA